MSDYMTWEEHRAIEAHRMGQVIPVADYVAPIIPGQEAEGEGFGPATSDHTHNLTVYEYAGVPSDAALIALDVGFTADTLVNGVMVLNTASNRLYVRIGGVWRYTTLT